MYKIFSPAKLAMIVMALAIVACAVGAPEPTATPVPTNTPLPTNTPEPTATPTDVPTPTATPNLAATQQAEDLMAMLRNLMDKGYIADTAGEAIYLDDFKTDWAQINYYNWYEIRDKPIADFVFSGHFNWSTASATPDVSGCGIGFGLQENGDHYAVFLDKSRILFQMGRGRYSYNVGVTKGSGRMSFDNPAEADFILAVRGQKAYVGVNGTFIEYTLSTDQTSAGYFAYSVLSGTNSGYGTRCQMTDMLLWTPK